MAAAARVTAAARGGSGAGDGSGEGDDGERRHAVVNIDESSLTMTAVAPADFATQAASKWECVLRQVAAIERLERGRGHILLVLLATGILLVLGLAVYGIKMTHKVAGPLYKVSLYLAKMRDGRYDTVYNLRKGDQLVDFYEHFKTAHAGVVELQKADIARLRAVLAAADAAGVAGTSPELDRQLEAARVLLAQKEKSLE